MRQVVGDSQDRDHDANSTSMPEGQVHQAGAVDHDGQHDLGELDLLDELALADHRSHRVRRRCP